ncbi:Cof-type HAD-IIB family hydrolase [Pseudalkalibacillus caeni]|uniref:HAD family phosphatase n=1 Tax=Exobacillus caeni TaxID=2574798 RepID=A0A5R9F891_9BACL|nr:Cof-type HAD-IIB family hydrolase [Pseudalkalibacillus caeni]TLS37848.1 HAD family phosphatase [Pseudalkalibacillus caeni]
MKEPHLIAIDLDGTLLTDDKEISARTKGILFEARKQGHHVVIATGRPYRASHMYYHELNLDTPIVNFNGAFVHHPLNDSWGVHHTPLDLSTAKSIINTCREFDVKNVMAEVIDDVYLHNHDEYIIDSFFNRDTPVQTGDLHRILKDDPTSLLIYPHEHQVKDLRHLLEHHHAEVIEHRVWAAPWNVIEIVRTGLNKAVGLQKIADYLNVPKNRIIAFGDEDNDLEMIEYAGHGVAMGNAIDDLKSIADSITKTNEEDGIAHYLEDVLKLRINTKESLL